MKQAKLFVVLLIVVLLPAFIFATGEKEKAETTAEKSVVKWYTGHKEELILNKVIDAFEKENPNVSVEYELLEYQKYDDYVNKTDLLIMAGDEGEIIEYANPAQVLDRGSKGMLASLNPYLDEEGINFDDEYTISIEQNGNYYGIPFGVKFWYVLINKNHLDEAGLEVPPINWTWQDYKDYAVALTEGEGADKRYGAMFFRGGLPNKFSMYSVKENNPLFYDDGTTTFDHPALKKFLDFRYNLENDDTAQMPYKEMIATKVHYSTAFFGEKVSMLVVGTWTLNHVKDLEKYPHDFVTAFAILPKWGADAPAGRTFTENSVWGINKNGDDIKAAYDFLRYISTDGFPILSLGFSAEKGADNSQILQNIVGGNEELFHMVSLKNVVNNRVDNPTTYYPPYHTVVEDIFYSETEKFLVGGVGLDQMLADLKSGAKKAIENFE
jgi:multiple sugar transport system substrate-binding protein